MPKPRFYEPGTIRPHPGVTHKPLNERCDLYVGEARALIEAGVLQEHMLPPRTSLSWRPAGVERLKGEYVPDVPGYLTVTRHPEGGYRAALTVSRETQSARTEARERRQAECVANIQRERAERPAGEQTRPSRKATPDDLRHYGTMCCKLLEQYIANGSDGFAFASAEQPALLAATAQLKQMLLAAPVQDTQRRKHLKLAWSA